MGGGAVQSESATIAMSGARRASPGERVGAGVVALGCLGVLVVAAGLTPSAEGHGTHTGLGLPECSWVVWFDVPCMTCGMTTAFSNAAHGNWLAALQSQPAGLAMCLITAMSFWLAAHVAVMGGARGGLAGRLLGGRTVWIVVGALLAAWGYKLLTWDAG